jgi:hypothetical protein
MNLYQNISTITVPSMQKVFYFVNHHTDATILGWVENRMSHLKWMCLMLMFHETGLKVFFKK